MLYVSKRLLVLLAGHLSHWLRLLHLLRSLRAWYVVNFCIIDIVPSSSVAWSWLVFPMRSYPVVLLRFYLLSFGMSTILAGYAPTYSFGISLLVSCILCARGCRRGYSDAFVCTNASVHENTASNKKGAILANHDLFACVCVCVCVCVWFLFVWREVVYQLVSHLVFFTQMYLNKRPSLVLL